MMALTYAYLLSNWQEGGRNVEIGPAACDGSPLIDTETVTGA
jgi:hypothetical protein